MSLEQYKKNDFNIDDFKGTGIKHLKSDFSTFKDMLNAEITNLLTIENDPINRLNGLIATEMTPEKLAQLKEQTDALLSKFEAEKEA